MIISIIIILIITLSGLSLTYLFAEKETFLWRLSVGNIVGSCVFGLVCFIIANVFGLSIVTVLISLLISALPLMLLKDKNRKRQLNADWNAGKGKLQGTSLRQVWKIVYYVFFFVLFIAFFDRAMIVENTGIFTGASQNLGDLPYHLGAIFSFTDGNNFPPQNPSFADAKFTYPFIADFLTACLVKLGASVQSAMLVQNVGWAFALLVILERFVFKVTGSRLAGKIAPFILFFSGGFGFLWFFKDYWNGTQGLWEILWNLPKDYTIDEKFRWGNSLVVLFITQRSLLLGMPLTIIVLNKLWQIFNIREENQPQINTDKNGSKKKKKKDKANKENSNKLLVYLSPFLVGLLAGTLPMIHAHSLAVLFIVSGFLFFFSLQNYKQWLAFGAGVCVLAVPELLWILSGSATETSEFIAWKFGWDSRGENLLLFWLKNTGIFIPLLIGSLAMIFFLQSRKVAEEEKDNREENKKTKGKVKKSLANTRHTSHVTRHVIFFLPFLFLFVVSNVAKFAPWEWDNIKVLIYWFVGSIPLVAFLLAWMWQKNNALKALAISCLVVLTFAGALDVWRTASAQMKNGVFDEDAVDIAEKIKLRTEPNALFLNAPTYNSAVVLSGRRSLMRYTGHLLSHGIDFKEREDDLKRIYAGEATANVLLKKYGIEYVLISPGERGSLQVNEEFFKTFDFVAEEGKYTVYKVK